MSLQELRELSANVPQIKDLAELKPYDNVQELKMDNGTLLMFGLYKDVGIAVSRVFATAGTRMPIHQHDRTEYVLVWEGELIFNFSGKEVTLKENEFYRIEPNTPHSVYWPVDTNLIAVVIPAEEGWPDGS